jgi:endonuclease/exonuclease/phosphatase (EEP) superfamily protein YafD
MNPMATESPPPWHRRLPWCFGIGLVQAGAAVAAAGTVLGYLGRWHWFLDLFAHFRGQYFAALAGTALLMGVARRPWSALLFLAAAAANAVALAPFFLPPPAADRAPEGGASTPGPPPLRVVTSNLLYRNPDPAPALAWLRATPADVVFLCEVTPEWSARLRTLSDLYPHQEHRPQHDPFGCAVLSRKPWARLEVKEFGPFASPSLAVRLDWHGREILLLGMHPTPPNGRAGSQFRDVALSEASEFLASHPVRTQILVGDLNATPWCHAFRSLLSRTGLTDTARGRGWQPTWNVGSLLFQIPIDHVLASPDLIATERSIGPDTGSDHRAVWVTLRQDAPRP